MNEKKVTWHGLQPSLQVFRLPEGARWLIVKTDSDSETHGSELAESLGSEAVLLTINEFSVSYFADNAAYHQTVTNPTIEALKKAGTMPE